jgi:hypothetical protein
MMLQRYNLENGLPLNYIKKLGFVAETPADFAQKLKRNAPLLYQQSKFILLLKKAHIFENIRLMLPSKEDDST